MIKYKKISNLSFILMIPYLLWCIYALTLNTSLYILN
jgi:benzodiazapine receptor